MPSCTFPTFIHSFMYYSILFEKKSKTNSEHNVISMITFVKTENYQLLKINTQ